MASIKIFINKTFWCASGQDRALPLPLLSYFPPLTILPPLALVWRRPVKSLHRLFFSLFWRNGRRNAVIENQNRWQCEQKQKQKKIPSYSTCAGKFKSLKGSDPDRLAFGSSAHFPKIYGKRSFPFPWHGIGKLSFPVPFWGLWKAFLSLSFTFPKFALAFR